jgi:hypothetical protein
MAPHKLMIIRHAKKAVEGRPGIGVDYEGMPDPENLTVRGWQRSGALARFFAAPCSGFAPEPLYSSV